MKKKLITFLPLFFAVSSFAQLQNSNELKGIITQSFSYYPGIKEAQNLVNTAQKRLNLTQTNLPTVNINGSYEYVQPKIALPLEVDGHLQEFQFAPVNNVNGNVGTEYLIFDFGRLKAAVDRSKSDLKYATDNVTNTQTQLASQVATIYYNIVYLKKAVAVEDSVLNYLNDNKKIAQDKLKYGDAIKLDVLNLQSQVDVEINHKEDLENNLQKQITLLQYTTGNANVSDTSFDFNVAVQPLQDAFITASASATDFVLAQDKVQQSKADLASTRLNDRPSVSLNATAGVKNGYVPAVNDPKFNYSGGVSLKFPIYNAKTKKQVAVAESQILQNQLAQETLNNNYRQNIQQALTDIETNTDKIANMQSQLNNAEAAVQIASSRYVNGIGLNTDITDAAVNLQRALLSKLQYQYDLCLAKIEYARLTGFKFW